MKDVGLLHETKLMLIKFFDMKDFGEASFVLGTEIHRDRPHGAFDCHRELISIES